MASNFHPARLLSRRAETADLVSLRVDLKGTGLAASLKSPGQYVQMRAPGAPEGFFAVASRPGEGDSFDFLVKAGTPVADALLALKEGESLELTPAQGPGYPLAPAHRGKDLLLFAAGSGISPIRALIWHLAAHREEYAGVTLFYGARTSADFAYQEEISAWEEEGVQVIRVVSRPESAQPGLARGYVQDALSQHPLVPADAIAFICGMPPMVQAVRAELAARGVDPENIYLNY